MSVTQAIEEESGMDEPSQNQSARRRELLRSVSRPSTTAAFVFVVLLAFIAIFSDFLTPFDPEDKDFTNVLSGPSRQHWLGTDGFGQDVLSRLIVGTRVAFAISLGSVSVAALIGVPYGLFLGYRGGWTDRLGSRVLDLSDALPGIVVGLALISALGRGVLSIMFAIGIIFSMGIARLVRAVCISERDKAYVDAARVTGLRSPQILFRQILPNLIVPFTAQASLMLGAAIIVESTLSFLDVGVEGASWGGLLASAAEEMGRHPFLVVPPGLTIVATVLAFNLVANGVSDVLGGTSVGVLRRRASAETAVRTSTAQSVEDDVSFTPGSLLEIRGVSVEVPRAGADPVYLVENAWLSIGEGEVVGLLGESGSGKSMLARAALGLLPRPTYLASGEVLLSGERISGLSDKELSGVRGPRMAAVFQSPSTALSPVHTIGKQICEPLRLHMGLSRKQARLRATELLAVVGVENPASRLNDYPHQFSGGMAQRVVIAMALAAEPDLLIADEATSALDVTTQAQVLDLLMDLREAMGMSILMITHDLGVVAETCDRVAVMYAGQIVEVNTVTQLFDNAQHPYTKALLAANPAIDQETTGRRPEIPGSVPAPGGWPKGCHFANRCAHTEAACSHSPVLFEDGVRCLTPGIALKDEVDA